MFSIRRVFDRQSSFARNAAWLFTGQGLGIVLQAGYFIALARLLGTLEYGIYAGAIALVAMVSQYSTLGSGLLFLRYVSPNHRAFPEYWGNILIAVTLAGGLIVLGLALAARWLIGPASASIIVIVGASECILGQLTSCTSQVFQALEKMRITATLNLLTNLMRFLLSIALLGVVHHANAKTWALGSLTVSFIATAIAVCTVTVRVGLPKFSLELARKRLGEGLLFSMSGSTTSAYNDLDKAMLSHYGMNVANGIYTMAYRVIDIGTIPIRSIQSAALPRLFRMGADGVPPVFDFARKIVKRTAPIGLLAAMGTFLLAPLVPHVLGHGFQSSVIALRWLCLIPFFRSLHLSSGDAIAGAGHQKRRFFAQLTAALLNLVINLQLIPKYGWVGAAWSSLATDALLAMTNWTLLYYLKLRDPIRSKIWAVSETVAP
jgi:O-antigen/teichoic acid export membrane protein